MRIMANSELNQQRLSWVSENLKIADKGDVFYFVGCLPHYDAIFADREELKLNDIPRSAVKLMNAAGITPVVSNDEKCCGHDLIWTGDEKNFIKLMEKNLELIKKSGAKKIIFSCPECYRTFDMDYQDFTGDLDFEFIHLSDYLIELIEDGKLTLPSHGKKLSATYHDSCRLGRHMGVYDSPRKLIEAVGIDLIEMENTKDKSSCCCVSAWMSCNSATMKLQLERMEEAKKTGADCLLTFCPKCQIHLNCSISEELPFEKEKVDLPVKDLTVALAELLDSE